MTDPTQRPLGELMSELTRETGTLVQKEIQLAKLEINAKVREATSDLTQVAVGGLAALAGALALIAALIIGLDWLLPLWASALLVGAVFTAVGVTFALSGLAKLKAIDPAPRQTIQTLQEDKQWVKEQAAR